MANLKLLLGSVDLPGMPGANLDSPRPMISRGSPALIALAVLAVGLIAFLLWDFVRQKRVERRERKRLERFREQKLKNLPKTQPGASSSN